jgi:hypothetical protein
MLPLSGEFMGAVRTKCPVTGQSIETGIETDEMSFRRFPPFVGRVFCPLCKTDHQWSNATAWVADEGKSSA